MDITTEISMNDFNMNFDEFDDFGEFDEVEAVQSTEMIEMEIGDSDFERAFSVNLDD